MIDITYTDFCGKGFTSTRNAQSLDAALAKISVCPGCGGVALALYCTPRCQREDFARLQTPKEAE